MLPEVRRRGTVIGLMSALLVVGAFGLGGAAASHATEKTVRCTYEVGSTGDIWENTIEDPAGVTQDGYISWGGCGWEFVDTDTGDYPVFSQFRDVTGEYTSLQLAIVDDVFGSTVGGFACGDVDSNYVCGEDDKNEIVAQFCGTSPTFTAVGDADGDGHEDFGGFMGTFVNGPYRQAMNCDATEAPTGATSGGVLDPAGGIFMTLAG